MEVAVGAGELGHPRRALRDRLLLLGDERLEVGDEPRAGVRGAAGAVLLDEQARLEDVLDLRGGDGHDERAALRIELEQPLGLELDERLAHRRAAQPELLGELVLAEQGAAGERAVQQALLDVRVHARGGGAPCGR